MMNEVRPAFVFFGADSNIFQESCDYVARIPRDLCTLEQLFDALERKLQLPQYFGRNWDALGECLRDLSWISARRVVIVHEDLPCIDTTALSTYLDVLLYCIKDWRPEEDHELVVAFPAEMRDEIECLIH
jgi:RNAse (barnase) inhibitor barstar